ncbi:MAG: ABC transporter [Methylibium sp. NZG]|nr:MAG: ABC transporter [Methylibium sp. NZG]
MSAAALTLHDLTVSYRGHPAVHHLSGAFPRGGLSAVVGPNGAGKSSLLGALSGVFGGGLSGGPGAAVIAVQGRIERDAAMRVAYLPQAASLDRSFPVRVHELVAGGLWAQTGSFGSVGPQGATSASRALEAVGLAGFERRWLGELSAGQVQRALFARLLLQDAGLILLDEPFNAIDARTTAELLGLLKRWKQELRTVIAVLHDLDQVREHFDHTLLLAREAVAWGPTAQVLRAENLHQARQMAEAWDDQAQRCERTA